jgi:hypothetical protein
MSQQKTRVVHCRRDRYDVYIGRPSVYGNPFSHLEGTLAKYKVATRQEAVAAYREWIHNPENVELLQRVRELRGKVLGCWCKPLSCHGDVLVEIADEHN